MAEGALVESRVVLSIFIVTLAQVEGSQRHCAIALRRCRTGGSLGLATGSCRRAAACHAASTLPGAVLEPGAVQERFRAEQCTSLQTFIHTGIKGCMFDAVREGRAIEPERRATSINCLRSARALRDKRQGGINCHSVGQWGEQRGGS